MPTPSAEVDPATGRLVRRPLFAIASVSFGPPAGESLVAALSNDILRSADPTDISEPFQVAMNDAGVTLLAPVLAAVASGAGFLYSVPLAVTGGTAPFANWPFLPPDPAPAMGPEDPELLRMHLDGTTLQFLFRTR